MLSSLLLMNVHDILCIYNLKVHHLSRSIDGCWSWNNEWWSWWCSTKTIIQTTPEKNHSRNTLSVLKLIYRRSGVRGCYTGLGPMLVRAFPANAEAIVTWELLAKLLGIKRD